MSKKGISVKVDKKSLKKLGLKLDEFGRFSVAIDRILRTEAQHAANEAARNAPVNDAHLRLSISAQRIKKGVYEITSRAPYSAFIEWGTRHKFSKSNLKDMKYLGIPNSYAAQFKATPLKRATNLKARPFFFNSVRKHFDKIKIKSKKSIQRIIKSRTAIKKNPSA